MQVEERDINSLLKRYRGGIARLPDGRLPWSVNHPHAVPASASPARWYPGKVRAVRLKLNAGRRRRQQTAAIPVEILFLMNVSAQQILHAREFHQHAIRAAELRRLCDRASYSPPEADDDEAKAAYVAPVRRPVWSPASRAETRLTHRAGRQTRCRAAGSATAHRQTHTSPERSRLLKRAVHRRLKVVVTRKPDARHAKARDAFSKMLVGRGGLILRQIARCNDQIAGTIFSVNSAKYSLITLRCSPQQRFMLFGKR